MTQARKHENYEAQVYRCHVPLCTRVAHPCDEASLAEVVEAAAKVIRPTLVGPKERIRRLADSLGASGRISCETLPSVHLRRAFPAPQV